MVLAGCVAALSRRVPAHEVLQRAGTSTWLHATSARCMLLIKAACGQLQRCVVLAVARRASGSGVQADSRMLLSFCHSGG